MYSVTQLLEGLEQLAPLQLAESWDNVGLLLGDPTAPISRVLTCLTVTPAVAEEAIDKQCQLIVSHHPILFKAVQRLTTSDSQGRMLWQLIRHNIAVYSAHTAYDSSAKGVNQQLAETFGLQAIQPLIPAPNDPAVGTGRYGQLPSPTTLHEFAAQVKGLLKAPQLHYAGRGDQLVQKVAVACGAAGQFASAAARQGCDVFVTGEARFHGSLEAEALGIGLIVAGHYQTERPAVAQLATQLAAIFPGLSTCASSADLDPLHWV